MDYKQSQSEPKIVGPTYSDYGILAGKPVRSLDEKIIHGWPVSIIIPAYNEEESIGKQLTDINRALQEYGDSFEVIVIDDGSDDRTSLEAVNAGARVLRHLDNKGYGAALKTGILAAEYDQIAIIDADGTYPADQIPSLISKLDSADMVVGARVGENVNVPLLRRPAKWVLRKLVARILESPIPDLNSGLRAFRRDCVKQYFPILSNGFSFTTTVTLAYLSDEYRVVYHPVNYYPRTGKSKIAPKHFMDFLILILRMAILFQPLKVFLPLALSVGFFGMLKITFDIFAFFSRNTLFGWSLFFEAVVSSSAILLLLTGLQLLLFGMVADAIVRRFSWHKDALEPSHGTLIVQPADALVEEVKDETLIGVK